jgi:hypothetical protein
MRINHRGGVDTFKYSQIHMLVTSMRFQVFGTGFMEGNFKNLVKWSEQEYFVSVEDIQENTLELRRRRCLVILPCKPFMNLGLPNPNMPPSALMGFPFKIHCSKMTTFTFKIWQNWIFSICFNGKTLSNCYKLITSSKMFAHRDDAFDVNNNVFIHHQMLWFKAVWVHPKMGSKIV